MSVGGPWDVNPNYPNPYASNIPWPYPYYPAPQQQGWSCGSCGRVWAPWFRGPCDCQEKPTPKCAHEFNGTPSNVCSKCGTWVHELDNTTYTGSNNGTYYYISSTGFTYQVKGDDDPDDGVPAEVK